jgi:hypothetical protein
MSANLSMVENYGSGFDRTEFPISPWLNEGTQFSKEEIEDHVAQLPQAQLPIRLREFLPPRRTDSESFRIQNVTEVLDKWIRSGGFDGLLVVPNAPFVAPPQRFAVSSRGGLVSIESRGNSDWPQVLIELTHSLTGSPLVRRVLFRPSGNTVQSEILYTRLHYTVSEVGSFLLASEITSDNQLVGISFNCEEMSEEQTNSMLYRAKIARKLGFIERIFNLHLTLPENITPSHVQYIEAVFLGLTEGDFTTRGNAVTVFVKAADVDLNVPPFSGVGRFEYSLGSEQALLFQPHEPYPVLGVGPYSLKLQRATIANTKMISRLRQGIDCWVRFEVLDNQITYHYQKYAQPERHRRVRQRLDRFHYLLNSEEPAILADTLLDPLISNISSEEAIKTGIGWLQYHDFPDRFAPQEPVLDHDRHCWQLPIYLVYSGGKYAPVGELLIDLKTGTLLDEPDPELMRHTGLALGDTILRAS